MDALLDATVKASGFFSRFKDDFDQETRAVRAYASPEILTDLWTSKLKATDGRRSGGNTTDSKTLVQKHPKDGFKDVATRLCDSLSIAISTMRSGQDLTLVKKIQNADKDIMTMLRSVSRDLGALNALLTELEMLSVLLERNGARKGSRRDQDKKLQSATRMVKEKPGIRDDQGADSGTNHHNKFDRRLKNPGRSFSRREDSQERQQSEDDQPNHRRGDDSDRDVDRDDDHQREDSDGGECDEDQQESNHHEEPERDDNDEDEDR